MEASSDLGYFIMFYLGTLMPRQRTFWEKWARQWHGYIWGIYLDAIAIIVILALVTSETQVWHWEAQF